MLQDGDIQYMPLSSDGHVGALVVLVPIHGFAHGTSWTIIAHGGYGGLLVLVGVQVGIAKKSPQLSPNLTARAIAGYHPNCLGRVQFNRMNHWCAIYAPPSESLDSF